MLEDEEDDGASGQSATIPKRKRGAQKRPGIVATLSLGVEITDEQ